jgi:hypothetical protein
MTYQNNRPKHAGYLKSSLWEIVVADKQYVMSFYLMVVSWTPNAQSERCLKTYVICNVFLFSFFLKLSGCKWLVMIVLIHTIEWNRFFCYVSFDHDKVRFCYVSFDHELHRALIVLVPSWFSERYVVQDVHLSSRNRGCILKFDPIVIVLLLVKIIGIELWLY